MSEAPFELTTDLDEGIRSAAQALAAAQRAVALTGAGLSVESGIPPFRGPGGLWTKHGEPPLDGYQRFIEDPKAAWEKMLAPAKGWGAELAERLAAAKPNRGHFALAALESEGRLYGVITQNVDDLHGQAGSRRLLEIHGNTSLYRCIDCVARFRRDQLEIDPASLPPSCPECGGLVKGDGVHFGEPIPEDVLRGCYEWMEGCDCMLVVGTSATVYPAAAFPMEVRGRDGILIEVNPYETELSPLTTHSLRGPGAAVLERLLHWARAGGAS